MSGVTITLTTTDKEAVAKQIARDLVSKKLAKCVQIDQTLSIYEWEGKIEESPEYRLVIKAPTENTKKIEEAITSLHNYELPQILTVDASGGSEKYIDWIKA